MDAIEKIHSFLESDKDSETDDDSVNSENLNSQISELKELLKIANETIASLKEIVDANPKNEGDVSNGD